MSDDDYTEGLRLVQKMNVPPSWRGCGHGQAAITAGPGWHQRSNAATICEATMSDYKVGDKVWISGTVRQVSEREPNALCDTYVVEIDNHKGHTDQTPVRFREGELLRSFAHLDSDAEYATHAIEAYGKGVRHQEREAIAEFVSGLRGDEFTLASIAIRGGEHLAGDDE